MNGFKSGASSDDPFGGAGTDDGSEPESVPAEIDKRDDDTDNEQPTSRSLPWIYARDSITDGRSKTVQLHLQESTIEDQREAKTAVENELGDSIKKADLREAALLVGLAHVDEVADLLREWGYDIK
ncbi:hypothetical protein [Saliphagus infecundisoli]|uniref:Uncharacterized protein n=1 Tax=Saliphagus infecundisoli TaxID=1849069 RepID=A0ABD5QL30_9EURY|nr:hypothetical protein [Saliphagus infecundisoli]